MISNATVFTPRYLMAFDHDITLEIARNNITAFGVVARPDA